MAVVVLENLEWSLPVPSVKELTTQPLQTVPTRYIRDDSADYPIALLSHPSFSVPLIDMAKLVNPNYQEMEIQKLQAACRDWGIFQLINHGISKELMRSIHSNTQEFFNYPIEDKIRYAQKPGNLEGYGQAFVISDEQKLEWCDMIFLRTLPSHIRNLEFWPEHPHNYRETISNYSEEIRVIAVSILGFIAMSLGLEATKFSKGFEDGKYDLRMNCYPPCPEPERVIGIASHADISGITLLLDCGDTPGLHVLKDGHWVTVEPMVEAIVVNTGHIVEIMSNGLYKAPYHRAVINRWKERLSLVTFCYPKTHVDIGPAEELIKAGSPPVYKTITHEEYFHRFFNRKLDANPFIDTLKM